MPKTKEPLTIAEQLRAHAERATGSKYEEAQELVAELDERREAAEAAIEALEELDNVSSALTAAADAVGTLTEVNIGSQYMADVLAQAVAIVDEAVGLVSNDDLQTFVEAQQTASDALETYADKKDEEPYPGKRDDLTDAWTDVTEALSNLADALESAEATQAAEEEEGRERGVSYQEQKMLDDVNRYGQLSVAGIDDCVVAMSLIAKERLVLVEGALSPEGGSGKVARP
jgi:hypothetical protein